jgi:hypothetical protein
MDTTDEAEQSPTITEESVDSLGEETSTENSAEDSTDVANRPRARPLLDVVVKKTPSVKTNRKPKTGSSNKVVSSSWL